MEDHVHYQHVVEVPGLVLGAARFHDFNFDRHFHLDFHIGLVTEGVQRQCFKGKSVLLGPGCISLMPPGEIHDGAKEGQEAYMLKTFRLSHDLLVGITEDSESRRGAAEFGGTLLEHPLLAAQLLRLHDAMQSSNASMTLALQSEWLTLIHILLSEARAEVPRDVKGALSHIHAKRIRDYCDAHLADKITLDELAALCGIGRFHFLRQFKQAVGMTPHAWLLRLRLEQSCSLLAHSSKTIAEVAQSVGFYDQSHFNRAFRLAFGVAPSNY
ncbi:HTH-type transcriptional activator RhaS [compost metagenome]